MLVSIGFSILAAIACACNPIESSPSQPNKWISTQVRVEQRCLVRENLSNSLNHLSLGTQPEVNHAKQILIDTSSRSPSCRSEVISLLMSAMDKPSIDFKDDEGSYYLWLYGAEILGNLKATRGIGSVDITLEFEHCNVQHINETSARHTWCNQDGAGGDTKAQCCLSRQFGS